MGAVYRAQDLRFKVEKIVAVKEMINQATDPEVQKTIVEGFEREANILATVSHPSIPTIYDYFTLGSRSYLVMEFVEGDNLEIKLQQRRAPFNEEEVIAWAIALCDVLDYLHTHEPEPIIFRDIKPANVMITRRNQVRLVDFGIAKTFQTGSKGTMIGTEGYSPPEQYRGVAEPRGDIYALGATMHHLLTNDDPRLETPFTFQERLPTALNEEVSKQVEAVIMKALEYDVRQRWSSAAEMRAALLDLAHMDAEALRAVEPGRLHERPGERLLWSFACEEEIRSTPLIYNGLLYIGAYDNNLYALDAETGKFVWKAPTQRGICSTAVGLGRLILFGSEDGSLYALDAQSGRTHWTVRTGGAVRSSPRIVSEIAYVGSDDQTVYAIDTRKGQQMWAYRTWGAVRSSAGLGGGKVYIGSSDGHVYAIDMRSGELQWKYRTGNVVVSSPCYAEGQICVGSWDSNVYALDEQSGWPTWKFRTGHRVTSSPFLYADRVYIGSSDGILYCIDARNGRLVWKFEAGSFITSSPEVNAGKVYVGAGNGRVYCLDAESGRELWAFPTGGPIPSSPCVAEGIVYIGSTDHKVYALRG